MTTMQYIQLMSSIGYKNELYKYTCNIFLQLVLNQVSNMHTLPLEASHTQHTHVALHIIHLYYRLSSLSSSVHIIVSLQCVLHQLLKINAVYKNIFVILNVCIQ